MKSTMVYHATLYHGTIVPCFETGKPWYTVVYHVFYQGMPWCYHGKLKPVNHGILWYHTMIDYGNVP